MAYRYTFTNYSEDARIALEQDAYVLMARAVKDPTKVHDLVAFAIGSGEVHALTLALRLDPSVVKNDSFKIVSSRVIKENEGRAEGEYLRGMVEYASTRDSFIAQNNGKDLFNVTAGIREARDIIASDRKVAPEMLAWARTGTTIDVLERKKSLEREIASKTAEIEEASAAIAGNSTLDILGKAARMFMVQAEGEDNKSQRVLFDAQALEITRLIGEESEPYEKDTKSSLKAQGIMFGDNAHKFYRGTLFGSEKLLDKLSESEISFEGSSALKNGNSFDSELGGGDF